MDSLLKHIGVNAMAPTTEKKSLLQGWQARARKHGLDLSRNLGCGHTVIREEEVGVQKPWWGRLWSEGSGTWPFMVGGGRGASGLGSSGLTDPLLRGLYSSPGWVPLDGIGKRGQLWFQVVWDQKSPACFCCMTWGFILLSLENNSVSCYRSSRTGPVWGWFCGCKTIRQRLKGEQYDGRIRLHCLTPVDQ